MKYLLLVLLSLSLIACDDSGSSNPEGNKYYPGYDDVGECGDLTHWIKTCQRICEDYSDNPVYVIDTPYEEIVNGETVYYTSMITRTYYTDNTCVINRISWEFMFNTLGAW